MVPRPGALLAAALSAAGCVEGAEVPEGPDLTGLVLAYDRPTADLGLEEARAVLDSSGELREQVELLDRLQVVTALAVDETSEELEERDQLALNVSGRIDLTGPCPGWDGEAPGAAGELTVTVPLRETRIDRTVWGAADACRIGRRRGEIETRAELSAAIEVDLDGPLPLPPPDEDRGYLFLVTGTLRIERDRTGATRAPAELDPLTFRRTGPLVEILIELGERGTCVVFWSDDGAIGVRDARGTITCGGPEEPCVRR